MRRIRFKNNHKNTIIKRIVIVFFFAIFNAFIIFNIYGNSISKKVIILVDQKLDKVLYQFFNELIDNDFIKNENVSDMLDITKNNKDEIVTVNYNMEKVYQVLTDISKVLKNGISDLEHGKIDILLDDDYLKSSKNGLVINIPLFLNSNNVFLNNIGPKIPIIVNFNETLLTNIKTKVTNYGFNNALLEVYITVEMQKLIITPVKKYNDKFHYEALINAIVINGSVPEFYGDVYESSSGILTNSYDIL